MAKGAAAEAPGGRGPTWKVVGGEGLGGIVVRVGREFDSEKASSRLSTGALVEELEAHGERLCYRLLEGNGPESGWVSRLLKDKELLVPAGSECLTVEGGRGFGRRLRVQVVKAFEEALELSWNVSLDPGRPPSAGSRALPAPEQPPKATLDGPPKGEAAALEVPPDHPDASGPHAAVVELVIDHLRGQRRRGAPCRPPQDAFVKRVECGVDDHAMIHNMPDGRHLLVSVVLTLKGEGRLRSAWVSTATRSVQDRPSKVTNMDPRGEERFRGVSCKCDGFVVPRKRNTAKVELRVRCLRCGCDYGMHELGREVPDGVECLDVCAEGRSELQQVLATTDSDSDDEIDLPIQVAAALQPERPQLVQPPAPGIPLWADASKALANRKGMATLSPDDAKPRFSLLFLHGFNENVEDWECKALFRPFVEQGLRVVLPGAPVCPITAYGGNRFPAWFDYLTDQNGNGEDELDGASLRQTRQHLGALIDKEARLLGQNGHRRVLVGGSSQGCCAAFDAYARHPKRLGGFVGLVGHPLSVTPLQESEQRKAPCFFFNGASDTYERWTWVLPAIRRLGKAGWTRVHARAFDGVTHYVGEEQEEAWFKQFLQQFLDFDAAS